MIFGNVPVDEAEGTILAHTVRAGTLTVKKGVRLSAAEVSALGGAGLLKDVPERLEPRESQSRKRATAKRGKVSAVVLAGGASKRMGKTNKLLAEVDGVALVRQAVAIVFWLPTI